MAGTTHIENERLEPLIGEWSMAIVMPDEDSPDDLPDVGARVTFEWMGDKVRPPALTVPIPRRLTGSP